MRFINLNIIRPALLLAACAILLLTSLALAEDVSVDTSRARIRSGPGNYYQVIYTAYRGAKLEVVSEEHGWYKVKLKDDTVGYVSKKSISKKQNYASTRKYNYDSRGRGVGTVSTGQIMAATRGVSDMGMFARKYAEKNNIDPSVLEALSIKPYTEREYRRFVSRLKDNDDLANGFSGQEMQGIDYDIGAAIALKIIATSKVSTDESLRKYVSLVGTAVTEKTPMYDEEFVFIVLDDEHPQSYSTPGGYVFITTGALKGMETEAELAGVLGHELVHVVERHGVKELEKQEIRIDSEKALDELEAEVSKRGMDEGNRAASDDLRQIADQLYERIISGRKGGNEDEADKLGTSLLAVRGYKATGLADFLLKAGDGGAKASEQTGTYKDADQRVSMIRVYMKMEHISPTRGKDFRERFKENIH